mmetsp:Transcript_4206/g.4758  ORF Transcript_4206/g.4758 Transcript_4206/m.4758 type:complete len:130 (-) Transcript_4206:895-1284(-)
MLFSFYSIIYSFHIFLEYLPFLIVFLLRGWNYVSCIGPIVLDKKVEMSSKCQKLTTMCRDVFKTHDDFNTTLGESEKYEMTFALIAGLIGVCLICISLFSKSPQQQRHRGSKKKDGEIEFVPIQDRSIS